MCEKEVSTTWAGGCCNWCTLRNNDYETHTSYGMHHSKMCHICSSYALPALSSSRSHNQHCYVVVKQQKQNSSSLAACLEAVNNQLPRDLNGSILTDNAIGCIQFVAGGEVSHCNILCCDTLWCKEAAAVATTQIAQSAGSAISTSCNQANLASAGEKKRKDYAFQHQFNEKPSMILGCPGHQQVLHRLVQAEQT